MIISLFKLFKTSRSSLNKSKLSDNLNSFSVYVDVRFLKLCCNNTPNIHIFILVSITFSYKSTFTFSYKSTFTFSYKSTFTFSYKSISHFHTNKLSHFHTNQLAHFQYHAFSFISSIVDSDRFSPEEKASVQAEAMNNLQVCKFTSPFLPCPPFHLKH